MAAGEGDRGGATGGYNCNHVFHLRGVDIPNDQLEVVQWLHANQTEGCTKNAMERALCNKRSYGSGGVVAQPNERFLMN
jgi:hypothetical protein